MPRRRLALALALASSTLALPGCATTKVERVWEVPGHGGSFEHLVVFGLSKRPGVRRAFEDAVVEALRAKGVAATPSYLLFPDAEEHSREEISSALAELGIDGILAAGLIDVDSRLSGLGGGPFIAAGGPPLGFYGFYHAMFGAMYSPGYLAEYEVVIIESNLYSADSGQLVWSALSETFDPDDVADAVESYGRAMSKTLVRADLVEPSA